MQTHTDTMDADFTNVKDVDFTVLFTGQFFSPNREACGAMVGLGLCLGKSGYGLGGLCPCNYVLQPDLRPFFVGERFRFFFFSGEAW